ncbi:hypothetical protein [Marinobacter mangrovi]|uniref:hypothetical protein n=1 Tax=Marinobacter mangrovi TaxID=2803918 RepID=UPI0019341B4B|nr:hypothetical protein [Marinobacter mangrovi]
MKIAHHCHASAQVIYAAKKDIPCLVLIREPVDAVTSFIIKSNESIGANAALREYLEFYQAVAKCAGKYVLADFETVIADFSKVIGAINAKYRVTFENWAAHSVDEKMVMDEVERLNRIRNKTVSTGYGTSATEEELAARRQKKMEIRKTIQDDLCRDLVSECESLYQSLRRQSV